MPKDTLRDTSSGTSNPQSPPARSEHRRSRCRHTQWGDSGKQCPTLPGDRWRPPPVIRLRTGDSVTGEPMAVTVRDGDATLAATDFTLEPNATEFLWVPQVNKPQAASLDINGASHDFTIEPQRQWTVHLIHHSH